MKKSDLILLTVLLSVCAFTIFIFVYIQKDHVGPNHPGYASYSTLFYNGKCSSANAEYMPDGDRVLTRISNLHETYNIEVSYEEALELFQEAAENLKKNMLMHDMIGVEENCKEETLNYYDIAIKALEKELAMN